MRSEEKPTEALARGGGEVLEVAELAEVVVVVLI
jgi:hypothetical protein